MKLKIFYLEIVVAFFKKIIFMICSLDCVSSDGDKQIILKQEKNDKNTERKHLSLSLRRLNT